MFWKGLMSRLKILSWWWGCQVIGGQKGHLFALGAQECDIIRSSTCKRSSCEVSIVQLIAQKSQQDLCFASKWHSTKGSGTTLIETLSDHTQWRNHPFFVLLLRFFFEDDNQASRTNIKYFTNISALKRTTNWKIYQNVVKTGIFQTVDFWNSVCSFFVSQ